MQIPCIERNGLGATRAVDAARLAMRSEHQRVISLDTVIEVMWKTGQDMKEMIRPAYFMHFQVSAPQHPELHLVPGT